MKQLVTLTRLNLGRVRQRPGLALVNILGIAVAVAVMSALLALSHGVVRMAGANVDPALAIVLSKAGGSEYTGTIPSSTAEIIADLPGVRRDVAGRPIIQPLALIGVELPRKDGGGVSNVPFRGTGEMGWKMTPGLRVVEGRMYTPGLRELLVGKGLQRQFAGLSVGDRVMLRGGEWRVTGVFEDGGGLSENVLLTDATTLMSAFERQTYQSIGVMLESATALPAFNRALGADPRLSVEAEPMAEYYRRETRQIASVLAFVGYFIGGIMALGVTFGAVMTMYAAVDQRTREYATLRALGYGATPILLALLVESLVVAIPGLILGAATAWLAFGQQRAAVQGLSFALSFDAGVLLSAGVFTVAIGLLGGIAPAIRAARLPIAESLRAV